MKKFGFILILLVGALSVESRSQSLVTTGVVRGVTRDSSGALIADAMVVLSARTTGESSLRRTNDAGLFVFPSQPVGSYRLEVTADGFRKASRRGHHRTGGPADHRKPPPPAWSRLPSRLPSRVNLLFCEPKTPTRVPWSIANLLESLPLNGRRFLDLALLVPNATPDGDSGLVSFAGEQGGEDTGYANGNGANSFTVDGASATSNYFGNARGGRKSPTSLARMPSRSSRLP